MARISPSPRRGEGRGEVLPILMYHSISDRNESHLRDYFKVCTSPERFREQMRTLKDNGFTGVDLQTGLDWLNHKNDGAPVSDPAQSAPPTPHFASSPPSPHWGEGRGEVPDSTLAPLRPVVITFDDGFQDFFTEAVPVMREHGFTATMYLPTAYIDDERGSFKDILCMTWNEVREARRAGMIFGSHTVNHPKLHGMPWNEIESELRDSRREIEDRLGEPVSDFAYPYAFPEADRVFCGRFRDSAEAAGYSTCVTTIIGRLNSGDDPYTLCRLPVNEADDGKLLLAKLVGAYDWLASAQRAVKQVKQTKKGSERGDKTGPSQPGR